MHPLIFEVKHKVINKELRYQRTTNCLRESMITIRQEQAEKLKLFLIKWKRIVSKDLFNLGNTILKKKSDKIT